MDESHQMVPGKFIYSREKGNNGGSTANLKYRNLTYNYCHKKGHIRADCWL